MLFHTKKVIQDWAQPLSLLGYRLLRTDHRVKKGHRLADAKKMLGGCQVPPTDRICCRWQRKIKRAQGRRKYRTCEGQIGSCALRKILFFYTSSNVLTRHFCVAPTGLQVNSGTVFNNALWYIWTCANINRPFTLDALLTVSQSPNRSSVRFQPGIWKQSVYRVRACFSADSDRYVRYSFAW